jgi:hypothetical protein
MKEPKTYEGRWWIFGKDKPEHFGILYCNPGERPLLSEIQEEKITTVRPAIIYVSHAATI